MEFSIDETQTLFDSSGKPYTSYSITTHYQGQRFQASPPPHSPQTQRLPCCRITHSSRRTQPPPMRSAYVCAFHASARACARACCVFCAAFPTALPRVPQPARNDTQAQRRYREFVALHDGLRGEVSGLPHHFPVWPFHLNRLAPEVVDGRRVALCSYLSAALAALHGGVMPARLRSFLQLPQAQANRMTAPAGPSGAAALLPLEKSDTVLVQRGVPAAALAVSSHLQL